MFLNIKNTDWCQQDKTLLAGICSFSLKPVEIRAEGLERAGPPVHISFGRVGDCQAKTEQHS